MQEQSGWSHGKALRWSPLPLRQLLQCTLLKLSRKPWLFQSWKQRGNEEPRFWKASQKAQNGVNKSHQSKQAKKSRHFLCLWLLYCSDWNCHLITFDHETPWSNLCLSKAAAEKKAQVETAQPSADKHSDSWETFFRCICNQPPNHVKQTAFFLGVYPRRSAERSWWIRAPGWWFLLLGECPKIVIFPDNLSLFVARHSLHFLRGNNQPSTNRLKVPWFTKQCKPRDRNHLKTGPNLWVLKKCFLCRLQTLHGNAPVAFTKPQKTPQKNHGSLAQRNQVLRGTAPMKFPWWKSTWAVTSWSHRWVDFGGRRSVGELF